MEDFKGTPGPWKWWTSNSFLRLSSEATGKDGDVIDSYKMSDGHTSLSVTYEDMNLIASAPELFDALQGLVHADCHSVRNSTVHIRALEKALSAMNKALGK